MASLDGYSLNEAIKRLREDVFEELTQQREAFSELYKYISQLEKRRAKLEEKILKPKPKQKKAMKEIANA